MMTWTVKFEGRNAESGYAIVTAENVEMAVIWLERELTYRGLPQEISHAQLIPMVTSTRKVRILTGTDHDS